MRGIFKIDKRRRVYLPKSFMDSCWQSSAQIVITTIPSKRCLLWYDFDAWNMVVREIESSFDDAKLCNAFKRIFLGMAEEVEIKDNRLLIPARLFELLELPDNRLIVLKDKNRFEFRNPEKLRP